LANIQLPLYGPNASHRAVKPGARLTPPRLCLCPLLSSPWQTLSMRLPGRVLPPSSSTAGSRVLSWRRRASGSLLLSLTNGWLQMHWATTRGHSARRPSPSSCRTLAWSQSSECTATSAGCQVRGRSCRGGREGQPRVVQQGGLCVWLP
jgi:hypothetical protein